MRKLLLSAALLASLTTYAADTTPVWCDPSVNQQNREPRRADFFAFENIDKAKGDKSASARYQSMEGMWKFNFVRNHQDAPRDFFGLKYDDSQWVDFPVPGLFELNGYGDKIYKNVGYAWGTTFKKHDPTINFTEAFALCGHCFNGNIFNYISFFHKAANYINLSF
jgi:beta-galactosidase